MIILGIGGILSDAASAILIDGATGGGGRRIEAGTRRRTQAGDLPEESIATCLALAGVKPEQVDCVAVVRPIPAAQESGLHLKLRGAISAKPDGAASIIIARTRPRPSTLRRSTKPRC